MVSVFVHLCGCGWYMYKLATVTCTFLQTIYTSFCSLNSPSCKHTPLLLLQCLSGGFLHILYFVDVEGNCFCKEGVELQKMTLATKLKSVLMETRSAVRSGKRASSRMQDSFFHSCPPLSFLLSLSLLLCEILR